MITNKEKILSRIRLINLIILTCATLLLVRLYIVQVDRHDSYLEKAQARYSASRSIKSNRGEVFDRNGYLLVGNKPSVTVVIDPSIIITPEQSELVVDICKTKLGLTEEEVWAKINNKTVKSTGEDGVVVERARRYAVIARDIDMLIGEDIKAEYNEKAKEVDAQIRAKRSEAMALAESNGETFNEPRLESIKNALYIEDGYIRYNPKGEMLSNILGFTTLDKGEFDGRYGVEDIYNESLAPRSSTVIYERSKQGLQLSYGNESIDGEEADGYNIYLTIDEPLQSIVEEEIQTIYDEFNPVGVCILMVEPKTGNILASAQRPSFDPNNRTKEVMNSEYYKVGEIPAWKFHPIEKVFEPGSIMKGLSISLSVDAGLVRPDSLFDGEGGRWVFMNRSLTDSTKSNIIPLSTAVQKSSNIVTAKIGLMLGRDRLYDGIKSFGIGEKTGLPFNYESRGLIAKKEKITDLDVTRIAIGYSVSVTPAQIVRAYCALANGGQLPQLRLIDRLEDPNSGSVITLNPEPPTQVFAHPETSKIMASMLKLVTQKGGTATRAAVPGFEIAGKTGTSRKTVTVQRADGSSVGRYKDGLYYSSFVGFVPAEDPAYVLLISVDEPKGAIYGGITCAPAFSRITERALKYLNIQPNPDLL